MAKVGYRRHRPLPGQPWKRGSQTIHTVWGNSLATRGKGYALIKSSDESQTSPGKAVIAQLLEIAAVRNPDRRTCRLHPAIRRWQELSGGDYGSSISFVGR